MFSHFLHMGCRLWKLLIVFVALPFEYDNKQNGENDRQHNLVFKTGQSHFQNRPLGSETGQYRESLVVAPVFATNRDTYATFALGDFRKGSTQGR